MNKLSAFATVDPNNGMNKNTPARCQNLVSGEWKDDDNEYPKRYLTPLMGMILFWYLIPLMQLSSSKT
ncbi:MAG: hypothetical protein Ct9H90mP13_07530 [Pseudomonadota bacterium]|nr:MAG: hypothetical protein Ct9H90mP13_07530 [Pseudomonadota bacterium]